MLSRPTTDQIILDCRNELLSILGSHDLTLAFRPVELATVALATLAVALVVLDGRSTRREGIVLVTGYGGAVVAYALAG